MGAVFIHSLWRAGSTYLWNRFRKLPGVYAYYEPFQEALGAATRDELAALSPDSWNSRHPHLDNGYYAEYLPLVADRGMPGFQKSFSIDHYFETDRAVLAAEQPYVSTLIDFAVRQSLTPVLGCCRSLGRAPWLKSAFGGTHIVLRRDPRQQWLSGYLRRRENGNAYFEIMPFQILGKSNWEPARRVARLLGIPNFEAASFFLERDRYFALFGNAASERSYAAFYAVNRLSLERALPVADFVIDIDRLSTELTYRTEVEHLAWAATALPVSFHDAAIARHDISIGMVDFAAIERGVDAMLGFDIAA